MYKPTHTKVWNGRIDEEDGLDGYRWHQVVQLLNAYKQVLEPANRGDVALIGFASDEGVKRNKGRVGASEGPYFLRKGLANMAWHHSSQKKVLDLGDVIPSGEKLEEAQVQLGEISGKLMDNNYLPVVLGGGHEVAWASFQGYLHSKYKGKNLGIVNFDAHFDLRKAEKASSGTPFLQMADWHRENNLPFDYLCMGIQSYGNTQALFHTADKLGVQYFTAEEIESNLLGVEDKLKEFINKVDFIYLSIDLDGFDAAYAPGTSAPAIGGMSPREVLGMIRTISQSRKLLMMDIAELNPSLDQDMRTAKLAARCVFEAVSLSS